MKNDVGALGFEPRSAGFHHAGSDPARINGSSLQLLVTGQQTRLQSHPINWSPRGYRVTPHPHRDRYALRIFCARFLRRIFFLRHFHRCLPRFFHAREPRFIRMTPRVSCRHYVGTYQPFDSVAGPSGISPSFEGFEPETSGLLPSR